MSHVSHIEIDITDLKALRLAAEALGLELMEGQKTFRWFGRWVNDYHNTDAAYHHGIDPKNYGKCEHALRIKGDTKGYEIGVIKKENGKFGLIWDHWGPGQKLTEKIGRNGENIKKNYASELAQSIARRKGFRVQKQVLENGSIRLRIQKGASGW